MRGRRGACNHVHYQPLGDVLMKKQQGFTLIELMI
ncbi:MAG: prepilin-type N-terminal cleavage/methylation domain-containing protein, partial [Stenotrophomonas sp.]